jgi:hypothetical protein
MSAIHEFMCEADEMADDYTIDAMIVVNEDLAFAVVYDPSRSRHAVMEGTRNEEGVVFQPHADGLLSLAEGIETVRLATLGVEMFSAAGGRA